MEPSSSHPLSPDRQVVPESLSAKRLDEVLVALYPEHSRSFLQKLVRRGRVQCNAKRVVRSNLRVRAGDRIELTTRSAEKGIPASNALGFVHVDPTLVVVDKPAGLVTHRNDRVPRGTVSDLVQARIGPLPETLGRRRPGVVHRLDRDTSGLLVLGRTSEALLDLQGQFRERSVEKTYLAIVHGVPSEEALELTGALGPVEPNADRQCVDPPEGGKPAETRVRLLERLGDYSLLECRPRTGRRHQIRVHLATAGLPIVGDRIYGPEAEDTSASPRLLEGPTFIGGLRRHALHAAELTIVHPATRERVTFRSELPADMRACLAFLRSAATL